MPTSSARVSELVVNWGQGDEAAHDALIPLVYAESDFFGGLSIEETAVAAGVSPATVKREWATARAWLRREINKGAQK